LRGEDEPGLATFDEDLSATASGNSVHSSAFDRAADVVPDEELAEQVAQLIDDEVSGLPQDPAPEEVVEALQDITDEVAAADLDISRPGLTTEDALESALLEADGAPDTALVDGGTADGGDIDGGIVDTDLIAESPTTLPSPITEDGGAAEAPAPSDPGGSPVGEAAGSPDVAEAPAEGPAIDAAPAEDLTADVATDVDVLTPDCEVATVEGTVTDEGVAAPEGDSGTAPGADTAAAEPAADVVTAEGARVDEAIGAGDGETGGAAADEIVATDEGGTPVAAATGHGTDVGGPDTGADDAAIAEGAAVDAIGDTGAAPTDDAGGGSELAGSQAAGAAPIEGYDGFTIAQLRGRLRGYQLPTVQDLLAYEEATRAREPYLRMLRNRLEKVERQAVENSPLAPRGA
jgi:hypothetical protein